MAVEPLSAQAQYSKNLKNAPYCKMMSVSMSAVILIAVDTLSNTMESEKTNKLIDEPDRDVY